MRRADRLRRELSGRRIGGHDNPRLGAYRQPLEVARIEGQKHISASAFGLDKMQGVIDHARLQPARGAALRRDEIALRQWCKHAYLTGESADQNPCGCRRQSARYLTEEGIVKALTASRRELDWTGALDDVEGRNAIPILTTHKSKGLEYDTVVFVGLEDSAHFSNLDGEQICTFFVALSRAKRRIVFAYSGVRPILRGRLQSQSRTAIASLYRGLAVQGVNPSSGS